MNRKTIFLFLSLITLVIFYGCCSHSSNSIFVKPQGDAVITSRESVIDELGRLPAVIFPSGAKIKGVEENTLTPGIVVYVTEQKISPQNSGYFSDSADITRADVYLYKIDAIQNNSDLFSYKTYVTTLEKPFKITLPSEQKGNGLCFLGIKESETDPWRFFSLTDNQDILFDLSGVRNSKVEAAKDYTFNIYRLGVQFTLIYYGGNTGNKLPDSFVSSLNASSTASILVKDGKYLEDLQIKGLMKGLRLDSFKPSNLIARITYRNNSQEVARIKVNNTFVEQTTDKDKTVPGKSYVHNFIISNITDTNLLNEDGEFNFVLNIKNVETELFPSEFLIEFYNRIESEKIHPYNYTEFFTIDKSESVTLTLKANNGNQISADSPLYRCNPSFTITSDYAFSDSDKAKIASAVRIIKVDSEVDASLTSSPISHGNASNAAPSVELSLASSATSSHPVARLHAAIRGGSPNLRFGEHPVLSSVSVSLATEAAQIEYVTDGVEKEWHDNSLLLTFDRNLDSDTSYIISLSEINDIKGITIVPFEDLTFKTVGNLEFTILSENRNILDSDNNLLSLRPIFTIVPNYELDNKCKELITDSIIVSDIVSGIASKTWRDNSLELSFSQNLVASKSYSISMSENINLKGFNIVTYPRLTFSTIGNIDFSVSTVEGSIFDLENSLYKFNPKFIISTSYNGLSESEKEAINNSISVTDVASKTIIRNWEDSKLIISFNQNLAPNSDYTLSMQDIDMEGISIKGFEPFSFITMASLAVNIFSAPDNVFVTTPTEVYHCRPFFTITTNLTMNDELKSGIAKSITVSNVDSNKISKVWTDNQTLTLGFTENLANDTDYSIIIADINEIDGVYIPASTLLNFKTMKALSFTVTPDADNVYTAMAPRYHCKPGFTITPNYILNDTNKSKIANSVSVSNANNTTKEWEGNNLKISFTSSLTPDSTHSLAMNAVNDITGVTVTSFQQQDFTTIATLSIALIPDADNVFYDDKYHCKPGFTITPSFNLNDEDKNKLFEAVSLSNVNENIVNKQWNGNNLILGLNQNLATSTDYTISMSAINDIKGMNVTGFDSLNFTTIPDLIVSIATSSYSIVTDYNSTTPLVVNAQNYYYCKPGFVVSTNMTLDEANKAKIYNALTASGTAAGLLTKAWNGNDLNLGFSDNLTASTSYSISISAINDIKGVTVKTFQPYNFTTFFFWGSGTDEDPFTIYTPVQLSCITYCVLKTYRYKQMENLDLSGYNNWVPVGVTNTSNWVTPPFYGLYNGNNKKISNAVINYPGKTNVGIFAQIYNSRITDLTLENISSEGSSCIGSLVGQSRQTEFDNIKIKDVIASGSPAGGICGYSNTNIFSNINAENIQVRGNSALGGICGSGENNFSNILCNNITVNAGTSGYYGGGITGYCNKIQIASCTVINSTMTGKANMGGGIGYLNQGIITNLKCKNITSIGNEYIGGSVGTTAKSSFTNLHCNNIIIKQNNNGNESFGGCIGYASDCSFSGVECASASIQAELGHFEGGGIGKIVKSTFNDINCASITISGSYMLGGFSGSVEDNCNFENMECNDIKITGTSTHAAGCVGKVQNTCNFTNVNCASATANGNTFIGGFVGQIENNCSLTNINCDNIVIDASYGFAGGCVGDTSNNCCFNNILCDKVKVEGIYYAGGFAGCSKNSTKDNCRVINSKIGKSSTQYCGGFAGILGGRETDYSKDVTLNCFANNNEVTATNICGGFAGTYNTIEDSSNKIYNCYVSDSVVSCVIDSSTGSNCGGFIGYNSKNGLIQNSSVSNTTISSKGTNTGGLVAYSNGIIESCYVASTSLDTEGSYIGGLVGYSKSNITSCYTDKVDIKAKQNCVGGLVGHQDNAKLIESCYVSKAKIKTEIANSRLCYGGLVGELSGNINLCYVNQTEIEGNQRVGGLAGNCGAGISVTKCFVKDTNITGYDTLIGGLIACAYKNTQIDSCYLNGCNITSTIEANSSNHAISSFIATNTAEITNCYVYNSTVAGKSNYGALIGYNSTSNSATISDCFISQNYTIFIDYNKNSTPLINCYYNVNDLSTFNGKTWSAGAWSNFNTSVFPPKLTDLAEP